MAISKGVARVEQDKAGGLIGTGTKTVFTNNKKTAQRSSIIITPPNKGDVIVYTPDTVFAENKPVAIQGSVTVRGYDVQRGSENVFVGDTGPGDVMIVEGDEMEDGTTATNGAAVIYIKKGIAKGILDQDMVERTENANSIFSAGGGGNSIPGKIQDCGGIHSLSSFPMSLQLSKNFTLENMLKKWKDGQSIQFPNHKLQDNKGFTVADLVCNLSLLCQNTLEPIYSKYPDFRVTNSFREGEKQAQHGNGQACDIIFNIRDKKLVFERCAWIKDNVPYDQLLLEYRDVGTHIQNWIHISFVGDNAYRNRKGEGPKGCRPAGDSNKVGTMYNDVWKASKLQLY